MRQNHVTSSTYIQLNEIHIVMFIHYIKHNKHNSLDWRIFKVLTKFALTVCNKMTDMKVDEGLIQIIVLY